MDPVSTNARIFLASFPTAEAEDLTAPHLSDANKKKQPNLTAGPYSKPRGASFFYSGRQIALRISRVGGRQY